MLSIAVCHTLVAHWSVPITHKINVATVVENLAIPIVIEKHNRTHVILTFLISSYRTMVKERDRESETWFHCLCIYHQIQVPSCLWELIINNIISINVYLYFYCLDTFRGYRHPLTWTVVYPITRFIDNDWTKLGRFHYYIIWCRVYWQFK